VIYIKTKTEIDFIRESCRLVAETLQLVKGHIREGITTRELDQIAEDYILSNNAVSASKGYAPGWAPPYPAAICISVDDEVVHGIPGDRVLKNGEIVSLDITVKKNRYFGDAALTVAVGEISEDKKKLMAVTERSLYLGIAEVKEDNRIHDISAAVQEYVESNGFSVVRDLTGHGVGKFLHEDPSIPNFGVRGTGKKLKSGMTIAIEPMVNMGKYDVVTARDGWTIKTKDASPAAHYEHTVLVNKNQCEILTVC
jgi:methionyl aminopeptidase